MLSSFLKFATDMHPSCKPYVLFKQLFLLVNQVIVCGKLPCFQQATAQLKNNASHSTADTPCIRIVRMLYANTSFHGRKRSHLNDSSLCSYSLPSLSLPTRMFFT